MIPANFVAGLTAWQEALFLRSGKVRRYYFITLTIEIFSAAVTIILFYLGLGILSLVVQTYLRTISTSLHNPMRSSNRLIWSSHPSFAAGLMIARWSLGRYLAILTSFTSNYGADFVLSAFVSTAAAGLYRASNRIVTAVSDLFAQPARMLAVTLFSRRAARKRRLDEVWPKVFAAFGIVGWPALAGLAITSDTLVPMVLGPQWAGAVWIVEILCLLKSFTILSAAVSTALVTSDRQKAVLIAQAGASIATILVLLLFSRFGVEAAAWGITAVSGIANVFSLAYALSEFPASRKIFNQAARAVLLTTVATLLAAEGAALYVLSRDYSPLWNVSASVAAEILVWIACSIYSARISSMPCKRSKAK